MMFNMITRILSKATSRHTNCFLCHIKYGIASLTNNLHAHSVKSFITESVMKKDCHIVYDVCVTQC